MPHRLVKCPECVKAGLRSQVMQVGASLRTLMGSFPYYDSKGRYHDHDPNVTSTSYKCGRGHEWTEKTTKKCWCEEDSYEESDDKSLDGIVEDLTQYISSKCFDWYAHQTSQQHPRTWFNMERARKAIAATLENYTGSPRDTSPEASEAAQEVYDECVWAEEEHVAKTEARAVMDTEKAAKIIDAYFDDRIKRQRAETG